MATLFNSGNFDGWLRREDEGSVPTLWGYSPYYSSTEGKISFTADTPLDGAISCGDKYHNPDEELVGVPDPPGVNQMCFVQKGGGTSIGLGMGMSGGNTGAHWFV